MNNKGNFLNDEVEKIKQNRTNIFELENIGSLQILINSNIPDSPIFPFTKDMIYSPLLQNDVTSNTRINRDSRGRFITEQVSQELNSKLDFSKLSEYPYFTNEIRYPKEKLALMEYHELVKFFFDEEEFQTILKYLLPSNTITRGYVQENNEHNIMATIELLFPTINPYKNNINTSINENINQINYSTGTLFPTNHYTFIRHNYKIYTTTKIIWINDVFNHPLYKLLIQKFNIFKKWAQIQDNKIEKEFESNQNKIKQLIRETDYELDINNLIEFIKSLQKGKDNRYSTEFSFTQKETASDLINIFSILNKYKEYSSKSDFNFLNFYKDVEPMILRYKPKKDEQVEVKINNYWYNAVIGDYEDKYDTYTIHILDIDKLPLLILPNIPIEQIRKPILLPLLKKKDDKKSIKFQISNLKKTSNGSYATIKLFLRHHWLQTPQLNIDEQAKLDKIVTYSYADYYEDKNGENKLRKLVEIDYRIEDNLKLFVEPKKEDDTKKTDVIINEQLEKLKYILNQRNIFQLEKKTKENMNASILFYERLDRVMKFHNDYLHEMKVDVNAKINTDYLEYLDFINTIKKYIDPTMISLNPKLQDIINNYANNIDSQTFINFMELCIPCLSTITSQCNVIKNPQFIEVINTDINIFNKDNNYSKYSIFLHMDFVEGQLDRAISADRGVLSKMNCMYSDELLTRQFNNLAYKRNSNTWIIQPSPFIQVEIPKEIPETNIPLQSESQFPPMLPQVDQRVSVPQSQEITNAQPTNFQYTNPFINKLNETNILQRYKEPYVPQHAQPAYELAPARAAGGYRKTSKNKKPHKRNTRYSNKKKYF